MTLPKLTTTDYNYTIPKAAACTTTGTGRYTWKTTTYGSYYFDVTIAATGHSYKTSVTAPTCTAQGYTTHTCSVCSNSYKDTYTNATGHSYSYKVSKAPATSVAGTLTGTCSKCSGTTTVTLPKLTTTDYTYKVTKAATCTTTGTGRYTWKTTTYGSFYFDVTIAVTGHSYGLKNSITKLPTVTDTGTFIAECSSMRCSDTIVITLPKLNSDEYLSEVVTLPTCTANGLEYYWWQNSSYGIVAFEISIPATGHSYAHTVVAPTTTSEGYTLHTCSICGDSYKDNYMDRLTYIVGDTDGN